MVYNLLLLCSFLNLTLVVYVSALHDAIEFKVAFKEHVENRSNKYHSDNQCRGLAMMHYFEKPLHLFNTHISNPFEVSPEKLTSKKKYEEAVIDNFEKIEGKGWANSKKFRMNYSAQGKGENAKMSLNNAYYLFSGLTGKNAKEIHSKDKDALTLMMKFEELEQMNFQVNQGLDNEVIKKVRKRYYFCFKYVVWKMGKIILIIRGPAYDLDEYHTRPSTGVTLRPPGDTGPPGTHFNHTDFTPPHEDGTPPHDDGTPPHDDGTPIHGTSLPHSYGIPP